MVQAIANHLENLLKSGAISPAQMGAISEAELTALYAFSLKELDAGQYENALKLLGGLTALDGSKAKYWRALGVAAQCASLNNEALMAYEKALALDNKSAYIYIYRAEIYLLQGKIGAAKEDLYTAYLLHKKHQLAPPLLERLDKTNKRLKSKESAISPPHKDAARPAPPQKAEKTEKAALKTGISQSFDEDLEKTLTAIKAIEKPSVAANSEKMAAHSIKAPLPHKKPAAKEEALDAEEATKTAIKAPFDPEVTKTSIKPIKGAP